MYHADNDFGYEPTSEDLQDWHNAEGSAVEKRFTLLGLYARLELIESMPRWRQEICGRPGEIQNLRAQMTKLEAENAAN